MLENLVDDLRIQRAEFSRDVEYLKESVLEEELDEAFESGESLFFLETTDELQEAAEWANMMECDNRDELMNDVLEVERILESDHDLTFDEMIDLDSIHVY